MLYCSECAEDQGWPLSIKRSLGRCEMCERPNRRCYDLETRYLVPEKAEDPVLVSESE